MSAGSALLCAGVLAVLALACAALSLACHAAGDLERRGGASPEDGGDSARADAQAHAPARQPERAPTRPQPRPQPRQQRQDALGDVPCTPAAHAERMAEIARMRQEMGW